MDDWVNTELIVIASEIENLEESEDKPLIQVLKNAYSERVYRETDSADRGKDSA